MSLHFPLPKIRTFRFSLHTSCLSLLKWSALWRWNSQWVHTFRFALRLCSDSLKWRQSRDKWLNAQDKWSSPAQSYIVHEVRSVRERERERERERDGSDVTIVALKEAQKRFLYCAWCALGEREREIYRESERERERWKWRHHCRAKIGDEFTLSLAKNSHLAMSLHFPLPKIRTFWFSLHISHLTLLKMVTIVALKFAMSSHFPLPKNSALLSVFRLSQ